MPLHLPDSLLALAASIDGDGGHEVCRTLSSLLHDAAPFDAGEVVLQEARGLHRFPFGGDERPLAGEDLVRHVLAHKVPLRLDDTPDLEPFPETAGFLAASQMRSALALPLGIILHVPSMPHAASPTGVLVVARRYGWAFVGASLNFMGPLAAMAGYALDRALALTALGHPAGGDAPDIAARESLRREGATLLSEVTQLRAEARTRAEEVQSLGERLARANDQLAEARGATRAAQSALDQALRRCHELEARLKDGPHEGEPASSVAPPAEEAPKGAPVPPPERTLSRRERRRRRGSFEPPSSTPGS
jgi:hypothetical protein